MITCLTLSHTLSLTQTNMQAGTHTHTTKITKVAKIYTHNERRFALKLCSGHLDDEGDDTIDVKLSRFDAKQNPRT